MANLMQRAVQQAKTEAAAQAASGGDQALSYTDKEQSHSQTAQDLSAATAKKALSAVLRKAARKMQEEDAEAAAAMQAHQEALPDLAADQLRQQQEVVDSDQLQLEGLIRQQSGSSSESGSANPLGKNQSLGDRLGSMLKNAFSPSRQSSYVPLEADSSPEAQEADKPSEQEPSGSGRRALPRDASLGQRLGSILTGGLSIPRQSSYTSVNDDDDVVLPDAQDEDTSNSGKQAVLGVAHRALPRDASLGQRLGSLITGALSIPRQTSYTPVNGDDDVDSGQKSGRGIRNHVSFSRQHSSLHDGNSSERVLPRELSLRERYGSLALSRDSSYALPAGNSLAGPAAEHESSVPVSPGRRRALPRDASYLPEWVTRSHGQTPRGDGNGSGNASPRCRLGTSVSNASTASDPEADAPMPTWVDWPQVTPQQAAEEASQSGSEPAVPILMAPPHLRRQQQDSQKAASSLPRAKRPLSFAPDPLSLTLVHTPSMNPQLDLSPIAPIATPKGQRLFDFWHQKLEQKASAATDTQTPVPASAVAPAIASEAHSSPATHADQPGEAQMPSPSTAQQAESAARGTNSVQNDVAGTTGLLHQLASSGAVPQPSQLPTHQSQQHHLRAAPSVPDLTTAAAAACLPPPNADGSDAFQPGTVSAAFVAELQSATWLVHKQSLQQGALLEGIEQALSQLSEQRLLVQNPPAAAVMSNDEGVSSGGEWLFLVHHEVDNFFRVLGLTIFRVSTTGFNNACVFSKATLLNACMCCRHVLISRPISLLHRPACSCATQTCCKKHDTGVSILLKWSQHLLGFSSKSEQHVNGDLIPISTCFRVISGKNIIWCRCGIHSNTRQWVARRRWSSSAC